MKERVGAGDFVQHLMAGVGDGVKDDGTAHNEDTTRARTDVWEKTGVAGRLQISDLWRRELRGYE